MQRIAIVGAAGFVGVNLAVRASRDGHELLLIDIKDRFKRLAASGLLAQPGVKFIEVDACELHPSDIGDVDCIFHLAALSHVEYSIHEPYEAIRNNILSLARVLETARKLAIPVIFTSSIEVYGGGDAGQTFLEGSPLDPLSPYGGSKAAGEMLVGSYINAYGLKASILRLTNLYGPWQLPDRLVPRVITQVLSNMRPEIDDLRFRDMVYIDDAVDALLEVFRRKAWGKVLNIASGRAIKTRVVAEAILKLPQDVSARARPLGDSGYDNVSPNDDGRGLSLVSSGELIKDELDWRPTVALEEGLSLTSAWYIRREEWWSQFHEFLWRDRSTPRFIVDYDTWGPLASA